MRTRPAIRFRKPDASRNDVFESDSDVVLTQFLCPSNRILACSRTCAYTSFLLKPVAKVEESAWTYFTKLISTLFSLSLSLSVGLRRAYHFCPSSLHTLLLVRKLELFRTRTDAPNNANPLAYLLLIGRI
jgi:hypothetical protein